MKLRECVRYLAEHDGYRILTHRTPDGDTVGSAAALCSALRRMGKTAWLYPNDGVTAKLRPFVKDYFEPEGFQPNCCVAVDVASENMFPRGFSGKVDLCVDHHPSNERFAARCLIEADRSSCGEIVLALIKELHGRPTAREANYLYIAVSTDTGCFQYANTDAKTFRAAAELVEFGARTAQLNQLLFRRVSHARLKLEGLIYDSLRFYREGQIVVALVTDEMLQRAGATEDDLDDLAGLAGRAEGQRVSITIRDWPGGASKVSVRSGPDFDASALCAVFGGGGHAMAAGCNIAAPPEKACELLLQVIDEVWK
ncbi:MAG: DHH family phosphoesterase [Oscillospiraceae bacterium]|nr:DHH family phosphoesterase [Oscillospiraceae bacterium]